MITKFIIYKILFSSGHFYIGKTKGLRKRRNRHLREMKDGTHHNINLVEMFKLYGTPAILIVEYARNEKYLDTKERRLLKKYLKHDLNLNIAQH